MLPAEVLKQISQVQLRAGHMVTDALAGNYLSAFKGRGMEFDEVREYVPGDDIRSIDWNVTARMNAPYIKVLREERELTLMLMVDVSPSQVFGTAPRTKAATAAELAAVLAYLAIRNNDKVGLIVFSDHIEEYIPPKKGRAHVWAIIRSVLTHKGGGSRTDIGGALDFLTRVVRRRSMCFMISDFWAADYGRSLRLAARRHDLTCVIAQDPFEKAIGPAGVALFHDSETGQYVEVDTGRPGFAEAYQQAAVTRMQDLTREFRRAGVASFPLITGESVVPPLVRFLREKEFRRGVR